MSLVGFALFLTALVGQSDQKAEPAKLTVSMVAVEARNEVGDEKAGKTKTYDKGIPVADQGAFSRLPYNRFSLLNTGKDTVDYGKEARLPINSTYTLSVKPISKARNGSIQAEIRMEEKHGQQPARNAVVSTTYLVPGDRLLLRLPQPAGTEIIVSLGIKE